MTDNSLVPEQLLRTYQLQYPEETATIQATQHFLKLDKQSIQTNDQIVVSAWVFNPHSGKILLSKNVRQQWTLLQSALPDNPQALQQATLIATSQVAQLQHLQLYTKELFHLNIQLNQAPDTAPHYQYNFSFLLYTHETIERSQPDTLKTQWISPSQITTNNQHQAIQTIAKKWQLFCYEKAALA